MSRIKSFTFNPFQENTYVVSDENGLCFIVDPGCYDTDEFSILKNYILENELTPKALLLTHAHIDHVLGNRRVFDEWGLHPQVHALETPILRAVPAYAAQFGLVADESPEPGASLADRQELTIGSIMLETIHAPGHSPGSLCFYCKQEDWLIGGDVLFYRSIGRSDLPGGDAQLLLQSIRRRLFVLPGETKVYAGHGPSTTIFEEMEENPFLR